MIRNWKVLGLALVAVCAIGATMASVASAQKITSTGSFALTGTSTGEAINNQLGAFGSTVHCHVHVEGHKAFSTPASGTKELLASGETQVTVTPKFTNCTDAAGHPATVLMTSCDFTFTLKPISGGSYPIEAHLECKVAGDQVHVEIYNNVAHTERLCTITFGAQTRSGGKAGNVAGGKLNVTGTFTNITATREGLCLLDGQGTSTSAATLTTDVLVEGKNKEGGTTHVTIS